MNASAVTPTVNPTLNQRQWLIQQKQDLLQKELLLEEYDKVQGAYHNLEEEAQIFEQKKSDYLQEEAQYEALGNSINMSSNGVNSPNGVNPSIQQGIPTGAPTVQGPQGPQGANAAYLSNASPFGGGIEGQFNPYAAYGAAPLPGEGQPYYQPLPSANFATPNAGNPTPPLAPIGAPPLNPLGVPTQASLQQQAQKAPVTPQDVAALRQLLQMNPQTAQQAASVSDADLTQLLKSDPEIAGAVKEFQTMMPAQNNPATATGASPQGAGQIPGPNTPMDPAQALKLAQQNPEVMQQAQAMLASLTPQERQQMMTQLQNDPEAQAILAQMGVSVPPQASGPANTPASGSGTAPTAPKPR